MERLDGNKIPSAEDLKKAGSSASVVAQGNPGDVPVLNAPEYNHFFFRIHFFQFIL